MAAVLAIDFESPAEVERQTALRVNERTNRQRGSGYKLGWEIPPNIERASASRDKKPPAKTVTKPKPSPVKSPVIVQPSVEINGRPLAIIADYDGLWGAIRDRVDAMQITRETLNGMAKLQDGYIGKLLGGAQRKKFGKRSLGKTLGAIGCDLALIEDEIQTAKIRAIDQIIAGTAAALGISRTELASLAGFKAVPPRKGMSEIDAALAPVGCRLALVEDSDATAKIMARCKKRERPLRPLGSADGGT
jgi:hypothetical protein